MVTEANIAKEAIPEIEIEQLDMKDQKKTVYPQKFIFLVLEKLKDNYIVSKHYTYAEGHIFNVTDRIDGKTYTVRLTPEIKDDWRV